MSDVLAAVGSLDMPDRAVWSVRVDASAHERDGRREVLVFVPYDHPLRDGFALLRRELDGILPDAIGTVRLVGCGVTLEATWPDWLRAHPRAGCAILTELDAYLPADRGALVVPLVQATEDWLTAHLGGAVGQLDASRVFRASMANRLLLRHFSDWCLLCGVREHHRTDTIVCPDPHWEKLLAGMQAGFDSHVGLLSRVIYAARLGASTVGSFAASCVRRGIEFGKERKGRALIDTKRSEELPATPELWVGLIGAWPYACRHVVKALDRSKHAGAVGVLLQDTLRAGEADAQRGLAQLAGVDEVFPALRTLELNRRVGAVEQCVSATTLTDFARVLVASAAASARAVSRAARSGPLLSNELPFRLDRDMRALALFLTIDVLRVQESILATERVIATRSFAGAHVIWPHASMANIAAPDLLLQRAGATTVELVHGAFADRLGYLSYAFSNSTIRATWTVTESDSLTDYARGQRGVGGFIPREAPRAHVPRRGPLRVLALTNYGSGVLGPTTALHARLAHFQRDFFVALRDALAGCDMPVSVRWRPHPADDERTIQQALAILPTEVSRLPRELNADLAEADIVVSTWSSALVEALAYDVPIFVHAIPFYEAVGVLGAFSDERRFRNAADLVPRFRRCAELASADASDTLDPERALRRAFFGEQGVPRDINTLFLPS